MNMKKLFLLNLPYLLFVYPFDTLSLFLSFVAGGSTLTKKARWEASAAV